MCFILPLYRLSYKVRRKQAVGTEDVKVTAINMYKYKERLRLYKRWPCSTYILNRINWRECSVTWSAILLSHMNHVSVSPTDGTGPTQGQRKTLTRVGIEPTTLTSVTLTYSVPTACSRLTLSSGDLTRRSWVQFPPWSEFFSVLVWAHFHQ